MDDRFECRNLGYSTKNIPEPSKKDFMKTLIAKTEKFV